MKNKSIAVSLSLGVILLIGILQVGSPRIGLLANQAETRQKPAASPATNDQPAWTQETGWVEKSIETQQGTRWYRVLRPKSYKAGNPAVVLLHGGGQSMRKIFEHNNNASGHWQSVAQQEGFLLIVPNGTTKRGDAAGDRQNWNDLREKVVAQPNVNDVEFIASLIASLQKKFEFDSKRVYVTGASNGGMMTFRMLVEKPELFAAGVSFIASLPEDLAGLKRPDTPAPLMMCNGTEDPLVKWEGGQVGRNRGTICSIDDAVKWWIGSNRCNSEPELVVELDDKDPNDGCRATRHVYSPKNNGVPFEFVKIEGGGHTLPSQHIELPENRLIQRLIGTMCRDLEGAELAWDFMKQHHR